MPAADEHAPDPYALHDLLRLCTAEQAAGRDRDPERRAALDRLWRWYLSMVDAAARLLYPDKVRLADPAGR